LGTAINYLQNKNNTSCHLFRNLVALPCET